VLAIVGSWTLYLQKRRSAACPRELTDERMLEQWADLWTGVLEGGRGKAAPRRRRRSPVDGRARGQ
jgi:hypothetical protein